MAPPPIKLPKELGRYMVPNEAVRVLQRKHWFSLWKPGCITIGSLFLLGIINQAAPKDAQVVRDIAVVVFLLVFGYFVWKWFDWYEDLFIATDKRLLNLHGVIVRKVEMMPLGKVTDMSYQRDPAQKFLGYGVFRLESAGQDQALSTINFVRNPDDTYRKITAEIFAPAARRATDVRPPPGSGSQLPVVEPDDVWWRRL
jgi:membrane protein YdbS with pleckstrin-like domain